MMRKLLGFFLCFGVSCLFGEEIKTRVETGGPSAGEVLTYQGPKARIAVGSFDVKAAKAGKEIGDGLVDMMVDALFKTGRFIVLEKGETLSDLKEEFEFGEEGWSEKAPEKGTFETADIVLTGAITAFDPEYQKTGGGGIVIPLPWEAGAGLKLGKKEAYIAATLRLVDVRTRRVINTAKVEGYASKSNFGIVGGALVGDVVLGAGFSKYKNTPMEKAVMVMLENAVTEVSRSVPEQYYRYTPEGKAVTEKTDGAETTGKAGEKEEGIVGGSDVFKPGSKILLAEDFSGYEAGDLPSGWEAAGGASVEIAEFKGKKWIRFLTPGEIKKKINVPDEYSLEVEVYATGTAGVRIGYNTGWEVFIGGPSSEIRYQEKSVKSGLDRKTVNKVALSRKAGAVRIFLNGKKVYQIKEAEEIKGKSKTITEVKILSEGVNPEEKKEVLLTSLTIAQYK